MTTPNGTVTDQVEGLVEAANDRGIKVGGEWRNMSKFHQLELPAQGARARLELDSKGFIRSVQVLDAAPPSTSSSDRTVEIRRLACLKAAATFCGHYATVHEDVKSTDVLKVAEAFERWVTKAD